MVFPLFSGVLFLPLGQALDHDLAAHIEAANGVEGVRHTLHVPDIAILIQAEIHHHGEASALPVQPCVVRKLRDRQREEQRTQEAVGAVLRRDDNKVGTASLSRQQQVHIVAAGDLVHKGILVKRQPIAQAGNDVAPQGILCFQEEAVVALGRVVRRQRGQLAVDLVDAVVGDHPVDRADAALLDGQQVPAGVLQIADVVEQRHEQVQLRSRPEVVRLLRRGCVLNDGVRHGLNQLSLGVQAVEAVPAVGVLHIQEVDRFHIVSLLFKMGGHLLEQFPFGICDEYGFSPLRAAEKKGDDKAPRLPAPGSPDAEQPIVVPRPHTVRNIQRVFIRIVRMALMLSHQHILHFLHGTHDQEFPHLFLREEAGGAVGPVGQDIEAPLVLLVFVSGEPEVTFFGNKTDEKEDHCRGSQPERCEQHEEIAKGIEHPNAPDLPGGAIGGTDPQPEGIEEQPVDVPACQRQRDIDRELFLIPGDPTPEFAVKQVLCFCEPAGSAEHGSPLLSPFQTAGQRACKG